MRCPKALVGAQCLAPLPSEVIIRQEEGKLIIEPYKKKSLLEVFANLDDIDEEFPDVDEGLLPLDDIEI